LEKEKDVDPDSREIGMTANGTLLTSMCNDKSEELLQNTPLTSSIRETRDGFYVHCNFCGLHLATVLARSKHLSMIWEKSLIYQ